MSRLFNSPYGEGSSGVAIKIKLPKKSSASGADRPAKKRNKLIAPIFAIGGYFKGSWKELRQVRWPNRRATWGLTAAVLLFTGLFVALIVSLDAIFSSLFNLIIK